MTYRQIWLQAAEEMGILHDDVINQILNETDDEQPGNAAKAASMHAPPGLERKIIELFKEQCLTGNSERLLAFWKKHQLP